MRKTLFCLAALMFISAAAAQDLMPDPAAGLPPVEDKSKAQERTVSETPTTRPTVTPLGIALENYDYPHPVQFLQMTNGEEVVRMGYMDVNPKRDRNGKTVLLLHGKNFAGYYWKDQIDAFVKEGYRVIVPDQVGWGKSSKPDMEYTFDLLAANTAKLLDHLKVDKSIVVGHSTGGMLAVKFATAHPQRVEKLVLEGPLGMEEYANVIPKPKPDALYEAEMKATTDEAIKDTYRAYFAHPKESEVDKLAEVPIRVRYSGEYPRWAKASARQYEMIHGQSVRNSYSSITAPTLIIVGDKDKTVPLAETMPAEQRATLGNYPKLAEKAKGDIPNSQVVIMEDTGHIPHLERSSEFNQKVLGFAKDKDPITKTE